MRGRSNIKDMNVDLIEKELNVFNKVFYNREVLQNEEELNDPSLNENLLLDEKQDSSYISTAFDDDKKDGVQLDVIDDSQLTGQVTNPEVIEMIEENIQDEECIKDLLKKNIQ